jgi:hypothetical protein
MELTMNYDYAQSIVLSQGWEEFFNMICEQYKELKLYQCSKAWFDNDEYICKFKGTKGDLIISWEHRMVG